MRCCLGIVFLAWIFSFAGNARPVPVGPSTPDANSVAFAVNFHSPSLAFDTWSGNFLVAYSAWGSKSSPAVEVFDRNGNNRETTEFWIDGASRVRIDSASADSKGTVYLSGLAVRDDGAHFHFIASVGPNGRPSSLIRTEPFAATEICAADDGSVWAFGHDLQLDRGKTSAHYAMLRQYDFNRGLRQALLDRQSVSIRRFHPEGMYPGEVNLRFNGQKIGLYTGSANEWIELDTHTNELRRWRLAPVPDSTRLQGLAFVPDGNVYAVLFNRAVTPPMVGLYRLDKAAGTWVPIPETVSPSASSSLSELYGNTQDSLVLRKNDLDSRLYFSPFPR
jgi:hypothetical protein